MNTKKIIITTLVLLIIVLGTIWFLLPYRLAVAYPPGKYILKVHERIETLSTNEGIVEQINNQQHDRWELEYAPRENKFQTVLMTLLETKLNRDKTSSGVIESVKFDSTTQQLEDVFSEEEITQYRPQPGIALKVVLEENTIIGIERANPEGNTPDRRERAKKREVGKAVPIQTFCFLQMEQCESLLPKKGVKLHSQWSKEAALLCSWGLTQVIVECELIRFSSRNSKKVAVIAYHTTLASKTNPFIVTNEHYETLTVDLQGEFEIEVRSGLPTQHVVRLDAKRVYQNENGSADGAEQNTNKQRSETLSETRTLIWER